MKQSFKLALAGLAVIATSLFTAPPEPARAQLPPSAVEIAAYEGLLKAAYEGDLDTLAELLANGADPEIQDAKGRTPLHVAAHASQEAIVEALIKAGADANALDGQAYDIVTIAAVANDRDMLKTALDLGTSPGNITSPYEGTALIAAAHLGHHEIVKMLIDAGAPLDHINNLHWTALMESVVLGDGGPDHIQCARHLLDAGADKSLADRNRVTPYQHAVNRGYEEMIALLK